MYPQSTSSSREIVCHRCQKPMELHSQQPVDGETMLVFRCPQCQQLEAVKTDKAA